ncbi:MAG: hypothetical protein ACREOB_05155 [Thermodesulfobacteriota bacterium]
MARSIVDYEGNETNQTSLDPLMKEIMEKNKKRKRRRRGYTDETIERRLASYGGHNLRAE